MPKIPPKKEKPSLTYIGIDPGASGGIITMTPDQYPINLIKMPDTIADLGERLRLLTIPSENNGRIIAYVEKVQGYIGPGTEGPGSSMFNFGMNYGSILMALHLVGIPYELVTPHSWQKYFKIPPRKRKEKETYADFKRRLKAKAQQLFPRIKVTLWNADALLICEYARRVYQG